MRTHARIAGIVGWAAAGLLIVLPLVALVVQAVSRRWFFPDVIPDEWTAEAVGDAVADPRFRDGMVTGLGVGLLVTALALALAVPAARAVALGGARRPRAWLAAFLVPTVLPAVALAMGLNTALLRLGLRGGWVAVVLAHLVVAVPYAVILLAAALMRYDAALERQALVLGASRRRTIVRVFLPLAWPSLAAVGALVFVISWGQYLLTVLPGGGRVETANLLAFAAADGGNPTVAATLALAAAVPPAVAVLLVVRHLMAHERPGGPSA